MSSITSRGRRLGALRALAALVTVSGSLIGAGAAHAAGTDVFYTASTWPADYAWDGGGTEPAANLLSTGDAYASYVQHYLAPGATPVCGPLGSDGAIPDCTSQHLRGGLVYTGADANGNPTTDPAVQAGDTLQLLNAQKTVVASAVVPPTQPVIASVIGSNTATIARGADAAFVDVSVYRRVPRMVKRDRIVPGTYLWQAKPVGTPDATLSTCEQYDFNTGVETDVTDVPPPKPTTDPGAKSIWALVRTSSCSHATDLIQGNPYEYLAQGRLSVVTDSAVTATFPQPLQAGDLLSYTETSESTANDITTSFESDTMAPVGTVPPPVPPDVTAPKVQSFDFGTTSMTVKSFKAHGLLTFVALDEASSVKEQLTVVPPKPKKTKSKGKKKSKKASAVPVVIAAGVGGTTAPGQTARVLLTIAPGGSKFLKQFKGKVHATLITTVTDAAGNAATSTVPYTFAAS